MSGIQPANEVLERHYLEIRCRILDLAAALERIERAERSEQVVDDPRMKRIAQALEILRTADSDRAERVQMLFSDEYQPGWNR